MALIPYSDETLLRIYVCPRCEDMYRAQVGDRYITCAVNHSPGSCCHYAEQAVSIAQMSDVRKALGGVWGGE